MNWFKSVWHVVATAWADSTSEVEATADMFTPRALRVLELARKEAIRLRHKEVTTEHVLIGLIKLRQGVAFNVLGKLRLDLSELCGELIKRTTVAGELVPPQEPPYQMRVKKVLALAIKEARGLKHHYIGTEHILLGILVEGNSLTAQMLREQEVDLAKMRKDIVQELDPNFGAPWA